ncbi:hypothetical protein V8B97DRAFT_1993595 [Scleroderma yunnanense]
MTTTSDGQQSLFHKLKPICVPLLEKSHLTHPEVPIVLRLFSSLENTLRQESDLSLSASLVSYVFYPISTILRRNALLQIPDQILEKLLNVLAILCNSWWWECELEIWSQLFMLCSSILGGLEGTGKDKVRSDETKQAAAHCLWVLLHERDNSRPPPGSPEYLSQTRLASLQGHAQSTKFIPILGHTIDSLLTASKSSHKPLQRISLQLLDVIIRLYVPDRLVPSVLPGVLSAMTRIALGSQESRGWANGDMVAGALLVVQRTVILSIGDSVCVTDGAVHSVVDLEDLVHLNQPSTPTTKETETAPFLTARTPSWLRASASQLHIALNALTPLVNHPTPIALVALATMAREILVTTSLTLPQSQPLLLSWLLSLSNSSYTTIAKTAYGYLLDIFTNNPTDVRHLLLQTLTHISKECMSSLPVSIAAQADSRLEHIAGQVQAICRLAVSTSGAAKGVGLSSISAGLDHLLGPSGGVEKWGWNLLSVLQFKSPPVAVNRIPVAQLLLERNPDTTENILFPEVTLKNSLSRSATDSLANMFRALGRASGDHSLYAVEWFIKTGLNSKSNTAASALWCAGRLLEGISGVSLDNDTSHTQDIVNHSKRLEKFTRGFARDLSDLWAVEPVDATTHPSAHDEDEIIPSTEVIKGLKQIRMTLDIAEPRSSSTASISDDDQSLLHRTFCLQLLAISSGILQARFTALLIHALYPILHSIVSPIPYCSLNALATLAFVANATSYASPANLLLSHFDYALDAVSRRLNRRWLDIDATKVLAVLVRLVGSDVVHKARDVVEECFDRLDEYHGYEVIVEGLVEVLGEVVRAIEANEPHADDKVKETDSLMVRDLSSLFEWIAYRNTPPMDDHSDYGPAPQKGWGDLEDEAKHDQSHGEPDDNIDTETPLSPVQCLTTQIISRSRHFLTHGSPFIRARILSLLTLATPVMPESALLPCIHQTWPFILNRLSDQEIFMGRRIWDDVWPRFNTILKKLEAADAHNALAQRGYGAVGTDSAYTHSHRLYRSIIKTMTAAVTGVYMQDNVSWEVILAFRRFLHRGAHLELQALARELYTALSKGNEDAVWVALMATSGRLTGDIAFLREVKWDIDYNVSQILRP